MGPVRNAALALLFEEMARLLEVRGESVFRVRAYERAAEQVAGLAEDVAAVAQRNALTRIPGIGKGLAAHIREYLATGGIAELEALRREVPRGVLELLRVRGLGPRTARLLHDRLGVDSVDRLEQAVASGEILAVPGIRERTRENIRRALRAYRLGQSRLPLGRALEVAASIATALGGAPGVDRLELAGSLRRRRETVGDLDVLVASRTPAAVVDAFAALPGAATVLARGDTRASIEVAAPGTATGAVQVDLRVVEPEAFGAALQYFTGSRDHNVRLRELARRRGLTISEYGVFEEATGRRVAGATEEEVYAAVGLPWIPPELREHAGELEAAAAGRLPDLVTLGHLRGDLHDHTDWSDGTMPLETLVARAEARGWDYVLVSDHSRAAAIARGLAPERVLEQVAAIRALQPRHRIRILAGTECDILADGRMDLPDEVLRRLDVVVAAVHSRFRQPRDEMTARIVRALAHPLVHILAHPTGRLIGTREPYDVDIEAVLAAARAHDKAVEINASAERLDLKDTHARRATELGVRIAISTDTHHPDDLERHPLGVATARRGWVTRAQVVNALPLDALLAWAHAGRGRG
ncbi:MAG TPA: DNA polymerase/3'-5' exonuclease PolX [Candidatus Tectomicrobia bacterium]|nr:DNA polymerase/3'-5' exonuclease PolX [Candidatus Tectomicrobia bacterium]